MKSLIFLLICLLTQSVFAETPRILIIYCSGNQCAVEDLVQATDAHILSAKDVKDRAALKVLANEVDDLDCSSENHRIIIDCTETDMTQDVPKEKLEIFSRWVGYDYIQITDMDLDQALQAIKEKEKSIPLTDADLPHISALLAGQIYDLMMQVDAFLKTHNLFYWGTCGTLLGAVRHNGLIPWDDDVDIAMMAHDIPKLLALKDALHDAGLDICLHRAGYYKIFAREGAPIKISAEFAEYFPDQEFFPWRFPFVDIFSMHITADNKVHYSCDAMRRSCRKEYFLPQEILASQMLMPFGPMLLPIPRNSLEIAERMYGKDWNRIAYAQYDHKNEQYRKKIKVKLTDRSSIPYVLPL